MDLPVSPERSYKSHKDTDVWGVYIPTSKTFSLGAHTIAVPVGGLLLHTEFHPHLYSVSPLWGKGIKLAP